MYAHFGISTGRSSRDQAARGKEIPVSSEAQPGDMLFYASGSYINHVAMYIGGGQLSMATQDRNLHRAVQLQDAVQGCHLPGLERWKRRRQIEEDGEKRKTKKIKK